MLLWPHVRSTDRWLINPPTVYKSSDGLRRCQSVVFSYIRAARSNVASLNVGPSNCNPIGSGFSPEVKPHGTLTPAIPAMLHVTVKTSHKYICSGSPAFSPALKAAVGVVGQRITSQLSKA